MRHVSTNLRSVKEETPDVKDWSDSMFTRFRRTERTERLEDLGSLEWASGLFLCQQEKDKAEEKTGGTWWDRRHKVMLSFASMKHDANQFGFKTLHTCFLS